VTYDFGAVRVQDRAGADLNVYKGDFGAVEFSLVTIEVSLDGITYFLANNVGAAVSIPGDGTHSNANFRNGYDFSGSGLSEIRYVRVDGVGSGSAGGTLGFDLDAIAGIQTRLVSAPEPGIALLLGLGLVGLVGVRRKV
jgi:hypothetical protein